MASSWVRLSRIIVTLNRNGMPRARRLSSACICRAALFLPRPWIAAAVSPMPWTDTRKSWIPACANAAARSGLARCMPWVITVGRSPMLAACATMSRIAGCRVGSPPMKSTNSLR